MGIIEYPKSPDSPNEIAPGASKFDAPGAIKV